MTVAYNKAAGLTPTTTFAGDQNGQTFDAGVSFTGAAFAGEALTLRTLIAAALIIGSVALVITVQQLRAPAQARPVPAAVPEVNCGR